MGLIPGATSTGSKRPEHLFGGEPGPTRMRRAVGCRVWDDAGREYLDYGMGLGAVALGYGHPEVTEAAQRAAAEGVTGPLPPVLEEEVASLLVAVLPGAEQVRFLKTGAEAVAAAVRIARVATGRELAVGCGYHGWHDWCSAGPGVPAAVRELFSEIPFNDAERTREMLRAAGDRLAAVVIEPVVGEEPSPEWLETVRAETARLGAILVFDEIKTAFRIAPGGAAERFGIQPDLTVVGKALGNGYPLAAVAGPERLMAHATRTWISSTLATETVALAAARAVLAVYRREPVCAHLHRVGTKLLFGLRQLAQTHPRVVVGARGIAEMCFLTVATDALSTRFAAEAARRGVLFRRTAYNFVSLAHDEGTVDRTLEILDSALAAC